MLFIDENILHFKKRFDYCKLYFYALARTYMLLFYLILSLEEFIVRRKLFLERKINRANGIKTDIGI